MQGTRTRDCVVIGAGVSGLAAARALATGRPGNAPRRGRRDGRQRRADERVLRLHAEIGPEGGLEGILRQLGLAPPQ